MPKPDYWKNIEFMPFKNLKVTEPPPGAPRSSLGEAERGQAETELEAIAHPDTKTVLWGSLPETEPMYQAILDYLKRNAKKTYHSESGEDARMSALDTTVKKGGDGFRDPRLAADTAKRISEGERKKVIPPPGSAEWKLAKIMVIKNQLLWNQYESCRQELRDALRTRNPLYEVRWTIQASPYHSEAPTISLPVLDQSLGEVLLLHGSGKGALKGIAANNFSHKFTRDYNEGKSGKPNYGWLGRSFYFSDSFAKVMTYTRCRVCGSYLKCACTSREGKPGKPLTPALRCFMLARVLMGLPYLKTPKKMPSGVSLRGEDKNRLAGQAIQLRGENNDKPGELMTMDRGVFPADAKYQSIYSRGYEFGDVDFCSGKNEFAVKDPAQIYPEFLVYYQLV
jgi:hypothetical protein